MSVTESTATTPQRVDAELAVRDVVDRFRGAVSRRDLDGAVDLFADNAVWLLPAGTFTGHDGVRKVLERDIRLSPTVRSRLTGTGVLATGHVGVVEEAVTTTVNGIDCEYPMVTVFELGDDQKIRWMRCYYDKLAIMQHVAERAPGARGWLSRRLTRTLVTQGQKVFERPEVPRENWDIAWRWMSGGDPSLIKRLFEATRLAAVIVTGTISQRPVQALGDEARRPLPGDEVVPAKVQFTDGITIRATPAEIWPWLVQQGCRRAGWYSYDRLDNGGIASADRIIPEFQEVKVGDIFPWTPTADDGFIVRAIEPERALVLGEETGSFSLSFVLEPIDATSTRLLTRGRAWYKTLASQFVIKLVFHPIHFGMQRRQLLNLKRRVERNAR